MINRSQFKRAVFYVFMFAIPVAAGLVLYYGYEVYRRQQARDARSIIAAQSEDYKAKLTAHLRAAEKSSAPAPLEAAPTPAPQGSPCSGSERASPCAGRGEVT